MRGWDPRARVRKVNRARKSLEESAFWATDDCVMVRSLGASRARLTSCCMHLLCPLRCSVRLKGEQADASKYDACMQVGTALVSLFLETANQPGLKRKVLPGLDPKAKLFWHASEYQMLRPREQTEGKSFMKKQGMVRCHDALLRELVSVDSVSRHRRLFAGRLCLH